MTQPDPDSSPEYDPYELFTEELDLDEFDLEPTSAPTPRAIVTHQEFATHPESTEAPFATQDEDRLYTDELIRQNEMASRSLFLSVITAAVISVGIGLWYLLSQKPTPTPQPVAPLPVPEQPVLTPPGLNTPVIPTVPTPPSNSFSNTPSNQVPSLAPSDSVTAPGNTLTPNPNLPSPTNPSGGIVPPPPPSPPALPKNSNR
jgi:hypothetical protein